MDNGQAGAVESHPCKHYSSGFWMAKIQVPPSPLQCVGTTVLPRSLRQHPCRALESTHSIVPCMKPEHVVLLFLQIPLRFLVP
jgi:hypothetical protein